MKKTTAGISLALVGAAVIFALVAFWRENWSANRQPGPVERFFARLLLSGSRNAGEDMPNPVAATPENLEEGLELYEKHCAFCHGRNGDGAPELGMQFYPPVPSLAQPPSDLTDVQRHFVIREGVRYTAMPSFEKVLSPDEIWKVVAWIHELPAGIKGGVPIPSTPAGP